MFKFIIDFIKILFYKEQKDSYIVYTMVGEKVLKVYSTDDYKKYIENEFVPMGRTYFRVDSNNELLGYFDKDLKQIEKPTIESDIKDYVDKVSAVIGDTYDVEFRYDKVSNVMFIVQEDNVTTKFIELITKIERVFEWQFDIEAVSITKDSLCYDHAMTIDKI